MSNDGFSRREFVAITAAGTTALALPETGASETVECSLTINGERHSVQVDARTTLLDLLRENLQLTGTKKGCDHGQCGACTVMVNGRRINACLSLAVMNDGYEVTTIEGLAGPQGLHAMQACKEHAQDGHGIKRPAERAGEFLSSLAGPIRALCAFVEHDGLQCGYCTPGQICSAVAMLGEVAKGDPSVVTGNLAQIRPIELTDDEIRERMSGNICRCGAYVGIVDAIRSVHQRSAA